MKLSHVYHLYRRAGFGIKPEQAKALTAFSVEEVVDRLISSSEKFTPLEIDLSMFDAYFAQNPKPRFKDFKKILVKNKHLKFDINKAWLDRLFDPTEILNERLTLFWANVFVCKDYVVPNVQQFNNTLRRFALGNFRDFTMAVAREPAMIKYLDNNKNKKEHPNENFARELMELFTLGVGNYSEKDVKEAARAFTGYGYKLDGTFYLKRRDHDYGIKEFMGRQGAFNGDDIISIICEQPACARFICTKLYTYFVNEVPNNRHIEELEDIFYPSLEIRPVIEYMFKAAWFYSEENIGTKIKSPVDLLTSINNIVPYEFAGEKEHVYIQRVTGQLLFSPPNVAGWKGGRDWISTNTLLLRMKLPSVFLGDGFVPTSHLRRLAGGRSFGDKLRIKKSWKEYERAYSGLNNAELIEAICPGPLQPGTQRMLSRETGLSSRETALQLMSLPEFQLT